jgi:hypothetical protein
MLHDPTYTGYRVPIGINQVQAMMGQQSEFQDSDVVMSD